MYIELHLLQNFAPACLNRDDTNSPKDCVFGGVRRARISSQCIKRAIREHTKQHADLSGNLGIRTKRLHQQLVDRLKDAGRNEQEATAAALTAIRLMGLDASAKEASEDEAESSEMLTQYILFLGESEITNLACLIDKHWDELMKAAANTGKKKKQSKKDIPEELHEALGTLLDAPKAADIALFGRMLADLPSKNVDAACQVAHAISTNKVSMEMDFYTAVDDLKPEDSSGADMMGTVEFNSSCFYRYAVIHWSQLLKNLGGDADLARKTVATFLRGACEAVPTGKQNSFAAHNPPSLVFAVVRDGKAPWSLANAFETPTRANGAGLVGDSIRKLDSYFGRLAAMYGADTRDALHCTVESEAVADHLGRRVATVGELVEAVIGCLPEAVR